MTTRRPYPFFVALFCPEFSHKSSFFPVQQEIYDIIMNNPVSAHIYDITTDHILWIVIINLFQISKLPLNTIFRQNICHLDIKFFLAFIADKINFLRVQLAYLNVIPAA